jgi:hypothetical protein
VPLNERTTRIINFLAGIIKQVFLTTPTSPAMRQKTPKIDFRIEPQLVEKIDAGARTPASALRTELPRWPYMIEHFLANETTQSGSHLSDRW